MIDHFNLRHKKLSWVGEHLTQNFVECQINHEYEQGFFCLFAVFPFCLVLCLFVFGGMQVFTGGRVAETFQNNSKWADLQQF